VSCADRPTDATPWILRVDGPASGVDNMSADEALLEGQKDPSALPVLRFFTWKVPTLTFGRLQDHHDAANRTMILGARAMARRPTGGGSVVHDKDLSFSLAWRRDHPSIPACVKNVYRGVHDVVRGALAGLGVETVFHQGPAAPGGQGLCFSEPVQDDLLWRGKKVLGGAMKVAGWGRLYQGNLLWKEMGLEEGPALRAVKAAFEREFFKTPPSSTVP
jgi:lipoate-protein ligase A